MGTSESSSHLGFSVILLALKLRSSAQREPPTLVNHRWRTSPSVALFPERSVSHSVPIVPTWGPSVEVSLSIGLSPFCLCLLVCLYQFFFFSPCSFCSFLFSHNSWKIAFISFGKISSSVCLSEVAQWAFCGSVSLLYRSRL